MPKVGMGPVRRRQLVDSTIWSIHEFGLADTTVTKIAKHAGVSSGIVHHYFANKDELLFETMRVMLAGLKEESVARLRPDMTARERLMAVVEACFAPEQFSGEVITAWLALYASARKSESLTRILALYHARLNSNLKFALKQLMDDEAAELEAESIAALIDGLYLRAALNPKRGEGEQALKVVSRFVERICTTNKLAG